MTDTITTSPIVLAAEIVDRGFHGDVREIRSFYRGLTPALLEPLRGALTAWVNQNGVARDDEFVDRLIAGALTDAADLRYFAGALHSLHTTRAVTFGVTTTDTLVFTPDLAVPELRENARRYLRTVREQWLAWSLDPDLGHNPRTWSEWMCSTGEDGPWTDSSIRAGAFDRDLINFLTWAQTHRDRFTENPMNPTLTATLHDLFPTLADFLDTYDRWATDTDERLPNHMSTRTRSGYERRLIRDGSLRGWAGSFHPEIERAYESNDLTADYDPRLPWDQGVSQYAAGFLRDIRELGYGTPRFDNPDAVTVPSGDNVVPISSEHPGWVAFWERVAEMAEEDGYQEQYNTLARAFGAATIDDEMSRDIDVTFTLDVTMRVQVTQTMRRRDYEDGEYEIDQSGIDDAIRQFVRDENADYEVYDSEWTES